MAIKFDNSLNAWTVSYSKRHPISKQAVSMRRTTIRDAFGVRSIKTKSEARIVYRELEKIVLDKFHRAKVPCWSTVISEYIESKRNIDWTEKTYENARSILHGDVFDVWKNRTIDSITTNEIKHFVREILKERSVTTQQSVLKFIRGTFQYAVDAGYLKGNPAPTIRLKINTKIKMVLTEEQVKIFLEKAKIYNSAWYPHWALAVYTGMRNGELFALTWDKVNFENRTILVDTSWNKYDNFKSTKSGDDRIVEIAPTLLLLLKELKLETYETGYVLPRSRNWEKGEQARIIKMFLQGLGLPPIRFHDLRATWATIMLSKGVEPIKVMSMGGWKALKTMQIYIRKAGVDIKGITDALDLHNPVEIKGKVMDFRS